MTNTNKVAPENCPGCFKIDLINQKIKLMDDNVTKEIVNIKDNVQNHTNTLRNWIISLMVLIALNITANITSIWKFSSSAAQLQTTTTDKLQTIYTTNEQLKSDVKFCVDKVYTFEDQLAGWKNSTNLLFKQYNELLNKIYSFHPQVHR